MGTTSKSTVKSDQVMPSTAVTEETQVIEVMDEAGVVDFGQFRLWPIRLLGQQLIS